MKKTLFLVTIVLQMTVVVGQIPTNYYNGTEGLSGETLKSKLHTIIKAGHKKNSYDDLYYYYESTDNFGNNKVWDMYSMDENGNAQYYYYFNGNDECGSYNSENDCYNREHSVPQSWMGAEGSIAKADLFVVVPSDGYVNGRRSNHPYGENNGEKFTSTNGSKVGKCTYPGYNGTCFEPIDCYKGDFARAYFYVVTRYNVSNWGGASFQGSGFSNWALNLFLEWHYADPVSQKEINRNNAVYNIQKNRNPYIDHPEWVASVFEGVPAIENPKNLDAKIVNSSNVEITWNLNNNNDDVILAYSENNSFGIPSGSYSVGNTIGGGGTIIYKGDAEQFTHTGISEQMYYKLWSYKNNRYSGGITTQAMPITNEPTADPTNFVASATTNNSITLTWTDAVGVVEPSYYLIKMSKKAENIKAPEDGKKYNNSNFKKNVAQGVQSVTFSNLTPNTEYFFKIYPYTDVDDFYDYKINTPPQVSEITNEATTNNLFVSEIAAGGYNQNAQNQYVELTNTSNKSIDLLDIDLEFYEGADLIVNLNLTGTVSPNSVYLIAVNQNYTGISPDFVSPTAFDLGENCHLLLKENNATIDIVGNVLDEFVVGNNYEFQQFSKSNQLVENWTNWGTQNGTPGVMNEQITITEKTKSEIKIFPNPNNGIFTISTPDERVQLVEIYDVTSKIVFREPNYYTKNKINISSVESGIYFIKIYTKNSILFDKIIKK